MKYLSKLKLFTFLALILFVLVACKNQTSGLTDQSSEVPTISPTVSNQVITSIQPSATPVPSSTPTTSPVIQMGLVTAVRLADPQSGWIGGNGWIARTDDGGKKWQPQYQGTGTIQQIFALNKQNAWTSVAENSNLLSTIDGGKHWILAGKLPNLGFMHFISKTEAFSSNARTIDGGKSWSALSVPANLVGDVYFHDITRGWAVTQTTNTLEVKQTLNGGKTWETVMTRQLDAPLNNGAIIRSSGKNDAWVEIIGNSGMNQTSYSLFHTTGNGKEWQTVLANSTAGGGPAPGFPIDYNKGPKNTGPKPGPLYVVSPTVAFMASQCPACEKSNSNSIGWTKDGGKTWVNGKEAFTGNGAELAFSDSNNGWWITTDIVEPSVMYTTSDGGLNWTKVHTFDRPKATS